MCNAIKENSSRSIQKKAHAYGNWKITKAATCTAKGSKEKVCANCGDKVTEVIPANGHQWKESYTVDKAATCTTEGTESIHCSVCNAIKENSSRSIQKKAHAYGNWKTTKKATELAAGVKTRTCSKCKKVEKQTIKQLKPTLPAVAITTPSSTAKKTATIKWKKLTKKNLKKIKKIEIQYSTDKNFKKNVKSKYASAKKTSYKIKSLKKGKKYYVRIRGYKKSSGKVHVSKWSAKKSFKVK